MGFIGDDASQGPPPHTLRPQKPPSPSLCSLPPDWSLRSCEGSAVPAAMFFPPPAGTLTLCNGKPNRTLFFISCLGQGVLSQQ